MSKKYIVKSDDNLYFVLGHGFVTECYGEASKLEQGQIDGLMLAGFVGTAFEATVSYAVNYIREGDLVDGVVQGNPKNPSKRRFATRDEANQHGSRFGTRVANKGDAPGSAGHIGFYVTESSDAVNAVINWKTGLTNSIE